LYDSYSISHDPVFALEAFIALKNSWSDNPRSFVDLLNSARGKGFSAPIGFVIAELLDPDPDPRVQISFNFQKKNN